MALTACSLILIGRTPPSLLCKSPFVILSCMAATDNDTDDTSNEKKLSQPSLLFLQVSKDDRSDIESSSDEDDSPPPNQKHHSSATNGTNKNHGTNGYLTGAPYTDEHWLNWYHRSHATDTIFQSVCMCVRVCVCVCLTVWWTHEQHCLSGTGSSWKIYVNAVLLLVSIFTNFLAQLILFIYIFASNYTEWAIKSLLLVQPTLCLANEWKHSTLWYKHATLTYTSLAYWGGVSFCLCLFMLFIFYKHIGRW